MGTHGSRYSGKHLDFLCFADSVCFLFVDPFIALIPHHDRIIYVFSLIPKELDWDFVFYSTPYTWESLYFVVCTACLCVCFLNASTVMPFCLRQCVILCDLHGLDSPESINVSFCIFCFSIQCRPDSSQLDVP